MPSPTGAANAVPASIPAHRVVGPFHFLPTLILAHYPLLLNQPGVAARQRRIPAILGAAPMSTQGKVRPTDAHPSEEPAGRRARGTSHLHAAEFGLAATTGAPRLGIRHTSQEDWHRDAYHDRLRPQAPRHETILGCPREFAPLATR